MQGIRTVVMLNYAIVSDKGVATNMADTPSVTQLQINKEQFESKYEGTPQARGRNQTEIEGCSPLPVLLTGCDCGFASITRRIPTMMRDPLHVPSPNHSRSRLLPPLPGKSREEGLNVNAALAALSRERSGGHAPLLTVLRNTASKIRSWIFIHCKQ